MILNENNFIDKGNSNRIINEAAVGKTLQFSTAVNRNGNSYNLDVDCANMKYYRDQRWSSKDDIRLDKRQFDKLLDQLKWLGFTEVDIHGNSSSVKESYEPDIDKLYQGVEFEHRGLLFNLLALDGSKDEYAIMCMDKAESEGTDEELYIGETVAKGTPIADIKKLIDKQWHIIEDSADIRLSESATPIQKKSSIYEKIDHCKAKIRSLTEEIDKLGNKYPDKKKELTAKLESYTSKLSILKKNIKSKLVK